jgi:hypothetical protein
MPNILLVQSGRLGDGKTCSGIPRRNRPLEKVKFGERKKADRQEDHVCRSHLQTFAVICMEEKSRSGAV